MSDWKRVRLGDYIHEYSVRNKDDAEIPVYSVTNSNGFCTEYFSKEVASKDKTTYKIVKKGYFAYNPSRINVGSVDWLRNEEMVIVSPLYNVFYVDDSIDQQYLYYFLKSPVGLYYISELASGSVRDNLKLSILSEFRIPLPDIKTQKEIAATLDSIVHTISVCNAILEKIDLLVKSRFVEMFSPYSNDTVSADTFLYDMRNGVSPSTSGTFFAKSLTLSAFTQGGFDESAWKEGYFDTCPPDDKRITDSDFYICRGNGNKSLVGSGAYSSKPYDDLVFPDTIIASKVDLRRISLPYLFVAWKQADIRTQIEMGARTTNGTFKINQKIIASIKVPLPPLDLQKQFAAFVEQTDKSKFIAEIIITTIRRVRLHDQF